MDQTLHILHHLDQHPVAAEDSEEQEAYREEELAEHLQFILELMAPEAQAQAAVVRDQQIAVTAGKDRLADPEEEAALEDLLL